MRSEPRLAWTTPSSAAALEPVLRLSRTDIRETLWALALSVIVHAGLLVGIGTIVLVARDRSVPTVLEVAVVTAAPEQSAAPPQPAPPVEPVTEAPAAPREAAPPVDPAPAAAASPPAEDAERQAEPAEPKPAPAEPAKAVEKPPEPAKPHSAPPQTAARPPAQISHGTEGTAHGVAHESSIAPTIKTLTTPTPEYPRVAIQYREEGTVYLTVTIGVDGVPTAVTLYKSSGFGSLDEAAIKTMRQWRFVPVLKNGRPEAVTIYVPMEFRLKHHDG